jgi:predicted DNA-binding transcriptional regulator YafY
MTSEFSPEELEAIEMLSAPLDTSPESRKAVAAALAKLDGVVEQRRQSDFPTDPTE